MGLLDTVANFIPGYRTIEGIGKGIGKVFQGDFKGAISAVGKGLSNDWGLAIASLAIPGLNAAAAGRLAFLGVNAARAAKAGAILKNPAVVAATPFLQKAGMVQLGAVAGDMLGLFGREGEGSARQADAMQYCGGRYAQQQGYYPPIQGPNIGW